MDFVKIKTINYLKGISKEIKTQTTDWKKIHKTCIQQEIFSQNIKKNFLQLNKKKKKTHNFKNEYKIFNRHLTEGTY